MPLIDELDLWDVEDMSSPEGGGYMILTHAPEEDSRCVLVSFLYDDEYEPEEDFYDNLTTDLYDLYQEIDMRWSYREDTSDLPEWANRKATVLIAR